MAMYCNNFEFNESRDDFLLNAEPPEFFAMYPNDPGPPGPPGPAGPGVAEGGTTGQLLAKASDEDYDTEWIDPPELDAGHVTYDDTETYEDGTVGKEISDLKDAIANKADVIVDSVGPAAIASFPDGADNMAIREITATIEPVQDLHGQDTPYPAGGGKNKLPLILENIKSINTDGTWSGNAYTLNGVTYTVIVDDGGNIEGASTSGTASAESDFYIYSQLLLPAARYTLNGCPSGGDATTYRIFGTNIGGDTGSGASATLDGVKITTVRINIKSGTNASGLVFKPMIRLESVTDATFAPYSNICPISGWTGANIGQCEANLWNSANVQNGYIDNADGTIKGTSAYKNTGWVKINPSTSYYVKTKQSSGAWGAWYDKDKKFISGVTGYINAVITSPATACYVRLTIIANGSGSSSTFGINFPASDHDYHAYTETTIPISWQTAAGTVFFGELTINEDGSVGLKSTHKSASYTDAWSVAGNGAFYLDDKAADGTGGAVNEKASVWCNMYPQGYCGEATSVAVDHPKTLCTQTLRGVRFIIYDTSFASVSAFNTYVAANPIQIVYELATPITYTLESIDQLYTKLGTNNIWFDCGKTRVTYPADTKLYIDKRIAALTA